MHILLVDDEPLFAGPLAERLGLRGLRVSVASDASEALYLLAADTADMAFVDVSMPGMNGVDLLARMKQEYPDVDVVMLSGANDVDIAVQAMRAGAQNWLRKPVCLDDVLAECQQGADRKKQRQQDARLAATAHLHSLGRVAEGVAHEVNNPVNIMMQAAGWVEDLLSDLSATLAKGPDTPQISEAATPSFQPLPASLPDDIMEEMRLALHSIQQQSKRVREITRRLLMFGKGLDAETRPLCVAKIVGQVLESLQARAEQQQAQIIVTIPPDLPLPVGSALEVYQVCMHCIENALDAMPTGGSLNIFATRQDVHTYELHFADTGHGIPPTVLSHIFEPFFSTRQVGKGTGLGLAVCQSLLHRRGASIFVKTSPPPACGTDMVVQLPIPSTSLKFTTI